MARTQPEQGIPTGIEVGRYPDETQAMEAVAYLAEADFPTEHLSIVGEGILLVQDSKGRRSPGQAFVSGASQGLWIGLMAGLCAALFMPAKSLSIVLIMSIVTATLVCGFGKMIYQMTGESRSGGVVYARRIVASQYVVIARARAQEAITLLERRRNGVAPRPLGEADPDAPAPTEPSKPAPPLEDESGRPLYGVRRNQAEQHDQPKRKEE
ncbi:MAG: general stress protein [Actinomycetaceae bacterium]|nr:general stress protein [Actinomycetaceae bacterium]MDU0969753.1 general stress protein [Actinomycetaceae bacterium]